jgi:hypothetical protein
MQALNRNFLSYLLAVAILVSGPAPLAYASGSKKDQEIKDAVTEILASTATTKVAGPQNSEAQISVTTIESDDEAKVLKEIVEAAPGPVVIFDNGQNLEEVQEAIEDLKLKDGQDVKIIEITAPDSRNWRQKFKDKMSQVRSGIKDRATYLKENKKTVRTAVLVNMAVTGMAGGVTYYFTQDLSVTFGTAVVLFATSTLRTVFTKDWVRYLDFGGRALNKLSDKVASLTDKVFNSISLHQKIDSQTVVKANESAIDITGAIMAATFAGSLTYAGVLALNGDLQATTMAGALAIGLLGAASSYDYLLFDVSGRYLLKAGLIDDKTYNKILKYATVVAPSIDSVYMAAPQFTPVKIVVIGLGVSGLVMAYKGAQVVRAISTAKTKAITSMNTYFSKKKETCETYLERYDKAGFIPYEDVAGAPSAY